MSLSRSGPTPRRPNHRLSPRTDNRLRRESLERRLPLPADRPGPDLLEIGEAWRELGRFDEALAAFAGVRGPDGALAMRLSRLARAGRVEAVTLERGPEIPPEMDIVLSFPTPGCV